MGGYVAWRAGMEEDGSDSLAQQVAPPSHWPWMRALILVVSADKKGVASTAGMQVTVQTSPLFMTRAAVVVPERMQLMEKAIDERDFATFAELTMRDSNSFHATCMDSWPPIHYLNDVSRAAMKVVENINDRAGTLICAYTFDAGPNAVIYYLEEETSRVAALFRSELRHVQGWDGAYAEVIEGDRLDSDFLDAKALEILRKGVSGVICTGVGGGPEKTNHHLVDEGGKPILDTL